MSTEWFVDLYSDTKTKPTAGMRAAMAAAEVGDEQQDEDPTVDVLTSRVARLLGKEQAIFLPSGTMANLVALLVHCRRGDEVLAEASSHVFHFETGGPAGIAGATLTPVQGDQGLFDLSTLRQAVRIARRNAPRSRLVWIEQTSNMGGGRVWPIDRLSSIRQFADDHDLLVHIDGARLMNAAVAASLAPAAYGTVAHSIWIDFTKGLGAPFGAVLAGSAEFVAVARRFKHMLGGAMRQAGIMAAGCLYALDHHVERLAEDHRAARRLADGLRAISCIEIINQVDTNIVILDVSGTGRTADQLSADLAHEGVRVGVFGEARVRLITHLDVPPGGIDLALDAFARVLNP